MNEDTPTPFDTVGDAPVEARIVAWVLGEASAFEAAELERLCEERPELLVFRRRMRALHGLLTEAESAEPDSSWKLSPEKRKILDEIFGEEKVTKLAPHLVRRETLQEQGIRRSGRRAILAIAACLAITFFVARLMPRKHEAEAIIEVRPRVSTISALGEDGGPASSPQPLTPQFFGTEFGKIKSSSSLEKVVDNLDLATRWNVDKESAIERVKDSIETKIVDGTDLMSIRVRDASKRDAQEITQEVVRAYESYRKSIEARDEENESKALNQAVRAQEDKVEERRKVLATIVRTKGVIYRGQDSFYAQSGVDEDQGARSALQTFNELEQEKMQLESQIGSIGRYDSDQLMGYASGLDLPDNVVKNLLPQYTEAKRNLESAKIKGLGADHPSVVKQAEQVKAMKDQLDEGVGNLKTTLQTQLEMANDRLKKVKIMADDSREDAIKAGLDAQDYADARRDFETDQKLLQAMKLKQIRGSITDKMTDDSVIVHEMTPKVELEKSVDFSPKLAAASPEPLEDPFGSDSQRRSATHQPEIQEVREQSIHAKAVAKSPSRFAAGAGSARMELPLPAESSVMTELSSLASNGLGQGSGNGGGSGTRAGGQRSSASSGKDSDSRASGENTSPATEQDEAIFTAADKAINRQTTPPEDVFLGSDAGAGQPLRANSASTPAPSDITAGMRRTSGAVESNLNFGKNEIANSAYYLGASDLSSSDLLSQGDSAAELARPGAEGLKNKAAKIEVVRELQNPTEYEPPIPAQESELLATLTSEIPAAETPYSTFSLNISDASFQLAKAALAKGERPDPASIKPEQFYNAVDYGDPAPTSNEPVAAAIEQSAHPLIPGRNLVRVALRTGSVGRSAVQPLRLTLLVDQSGSMVREDRRALMEHALSQLGVLLTPADLVNVIGFSRTPRLLADGMSGDQATKLSELINQTASEGGTNLEEAMKLGGQLAERHRLDGAQNRIVLFTDGAANLGDANPARLAEQVKAFRQKGLAFDIAGIGADGLNDRLLSELARNGNGRYYVVGNEKDDSFARQLAGAFRPAAENVKVQVNFNPQRVGNYKLIGFEKDRLKTEDFRNDAVDAAELAAEEAGVAIYQVETLAEGAGELGDVSVRFRDTTSGEMVERTWSLPYDAQATAFDRATPSMQLSGLSMLAAEKLRGGPLADAIDFNQLTGPAAFVKQFYGSSPRVADMLRVIDALK